MLKKIIRIGFMFFLSVGIHGQITEKYTISTFAGGVKTISEEKEGGPAEYAYFGSMLGLTVAPTGDIYVADTLRDRICRITPDGKMFKVAGRGKLPDPCSIETTARRGYRFRVDGIAAFVDGEPASTVDLNSPMGVAVDRNGNIYISDTDNNRVLKVNNAGIICTIAGDGLPDYSGDGGPAKQARLAYPMGIAVDSPGNLYIADSANKRIRMIDTNGMIRTIAGNGKSKGGRNGDPATKTGLAYPAGVAVDANGIVYIADSANARIKRINRDGRIEFIAGTGKHEYTGDEMPAVQSGLFAPVGVATDEPGNIYIADRANWRVRKIDRNGIIRTIAGGVKSTNLRPDGVLGTRSHVSPDGIAVDAAGTVYIADQGTIRRLAPEGSH